MPLNRKEQKRLKVQNEMNFGVMTGKKGVKILSLFLRHVRRILSNNRPEI